MMSPKIAGRRPPFVGSPCPDRSSGRRRNIVTAPAAIQVHSSEGEVITRISRNCIVNAVVKNKIATARNERLGNATKRKTRQDVLDAMDLQELHAERAVMARMGFLDKINELDVIIEEKRVRLKKEKDQQEQSMLQQKMNELQISHARRSTAMENLQAARLTDLKEKCATEIEELKRKHTYEYDALANL